VLPTEEIVSYTDIKGFVQKEIECELLEKVIFIPEGDYHTESFRCAELVKIIELSSITYSRNLIANGYFNFKKGNFGASALAYNEAGKRLSRHDESAAMDAWTQAFEASGRWLGVENPYVFDPLQQKNVISPKMSDALYKYQSDNGLPQTGKLDYRTLDLGSDVKLHKMLYKPPKSQL